ncbi:MAG TPA: uroporphyrinogen decarboxylase [Acidimicrobiales bacterium]|nr:uroporphyrinogen decarboxylase [Acidimicrobiales bacterium]
MAASSDRSDRFLRACRREPVDVTPIWFMRQAGRCLPEYRAVRERHGMFEIMANAELTAEVTRQPVDRLGVDAAILFSDIVLPLSAIGVDVEIKPGVGPVFADPFRTAADLERLRPLEPDTDMAPVLDAVRSLSADLPVPLIGFAGAPFTVASYFVEGGPSRDYAKTKSLMRAEPALWSALLDRLADLAIASLRAQVGAGAAAIQLFDSWAGALAPEDYRGRVMPASARIFAALTDLDVPRIHFGVGTGELLADFGAAGADVVGVDWRIPMDEARRRVGEGYALQGNLDPALCTAPWSVVETAAQDVLDRVGGAPGHVFNLGHGVLPETDPDVLTQLVDFVHANG